MDVIEVKDFFKSYAGKPVHDGVSFTVKQGQCLGLLGGSGVGKSVLLRALIGLEKPDEGKIFIEGEEISKYDEKALVAIRKKVAYVFQNGALFDSMTVFDNLAYPLREHTNFTEVQIADKITFLLEEFGLPHNEQLFPSELSGGMQKRVGMARAIILTPDIVLYDEPTAGLDPYNTRKIQEMIIKQKRKGSSSIFVTHDIPSALAVCDHLALLMNGRIVASGTIEDLRNDPNGLLQAFIDGREAA